MNITQFLKRNVKILGRKLHSPSLKDVACLEDVQLSFLMFRTFVCKLGKIDKRLDAVRGKNVQTNTEIKKKKIAERLVA